MPACAGCSAALAPLRYQGRARKWCSEACRLRTKYRTDAEYRSATAAKAAERYRRNYQPKVHSLTCAVCETAFTASRSNIKYCAPACKYRAHYLGRRGRRAGADRSPYSLANIAERDGWDCSLCDEPIDRLISYPDEMCVSVDHVVPLARGGSDTLTNVALAHLVCNKRKGARVTA